MYVAAGKNKLYAAQGRAGTNDWAKKVRDLFQADQELSDYYNKTLADGKWSHMMDQTHIGYYLLAGTAAKQSCRPSKRLPFPRPRRWRWPSKANRRRSMARKRPRPALRSTRSIGNRGGSTFSIAAKRHLKFSITPEAEWIKSSLSHGTVQAEQRVEVAIDWDKAPAGASQSSITIAGAGGKIGVNVRAFKPAEPSPAVARWFCRKRWLRVDRSRALHEENRHSRGPVGQTRRFRPHAFGHDHFSD